MKTRAQSWADRLRELRAIVRENGERLDVELREHYRREHDGAWWTAFSNAAEAGAEIPAAVWRSAEHFAGDDTGRAGWVARLKVRDATRRSRSNPGEPI